MTTVVHTEGLSKHYPGLIALDGLNLDVNQEEVFGYLGPNGAGKTTTIRLLLGLVRATAGRAEIFGLDCQRQAPEVHRRVAYVGSDANLWPNLTGAETLRLLGRIQGTTDEKYRDELVERFSLDPSKKIRGYSRGNRQKVLLIAGLMTRADLLVLDEPTSGLDPLMEQVFRTAVWEAKNRGQTVFLSSHLLGEVEALCDRVGILREGRLVELGSLSDMRHLSSLRVEVTFRTQVPDLSKIPGVSAVEIRGQVVQCHVTGSMEPLVHVLGCADVTEILSREPSLEELFLAVYGDRVTESDARGTP
jgi:ABC-2 type transport system ATP-binding protein